MVSTEQVLEARADARRVVADLPEAFDGARALRVGRVVLGDAETYACAHILVQRLDEQYATHLAIRVDDELTDEVRWLLMPAHSEFRGLAEAEADLRVR